MSQTHVLRLDDYRDRREQRIRLAASLYRADPARAKVLRHLQQVLYVVGADRAATVWVDEYGPGVVHPHAVLDVLSDRPRRAFSREDLRQAWDHGVPGLHDSAGSGATSTDSLFPGAGGLAVALGSDGARAWFLVADSVAPRPPLSAEQRAHLMFLAGECSAIVLHADMDELTGEAQGWDARPGAKRRRFTGWAILQDIVGREDSDAESQRIALRFIVMRIAMQLVEDDLGTPRDRIVDQVRHAREEIHKDDNLEKSGDPVEAGLWERVLHTLEDDRLEALASALLDFGEHVEEQAHLNGAGEIFQTGYLVATATGAAAQAIDAARYAGRVLRRMARWDEALRWYQVAEDIAEVWEDAGRRSAVLVGRGSVLTERGNLPAAREVLGEALAVASYSGVAASQALAFHGLMTLEALAGRRGLAIDYGWRALNLAAGDRQQQLHALIQLATVLRDSGEFEAARDAYLVAVRLDRHDVYRVYALDALAYVAALQGDARGFASWAAEADAMEWEQGSLSAKSEILYYRGLSYEALGQREKAEEWLRRAVTFAEAHQFHRIIFQATDALERVKSSAPAPTAPEGVESGSLPEVRSRLREMRSEVTLASL